MPYVIFNKATKQVVGRVGKESAIAQELLNITVSELGGVVDDYDVAPLAPEKTPGHIYQITDAGEAVMVPTPKNVERARIREEVRIKLGLTLVEFESLRN